MTQRNSLKYIRVGLTVAVLFFLGLYIPMDLIDHGVDKPLFRVLYWLSVVLLTLDFGYNMSVYKKQDGEAFSLSSKVSLSSLIVDGLAAVPFLLISPLWGIKLIQLIKSFSISRYVRDIKQLDVKYDRSLSVLLFVFWLVVLIHWISCGWLAIRGLDESLDLYSNYIASLYWTITTLTSVGYGDITPDGNIEMLYAMLVQLIGVAGLGYVIANVVSIVSKKDHVEARYIDHVDQLSTTLKRREMPQDVQARILRYYAYMRDEKVGYDESAFLATLPQGLRHEVALILRKEFIERIPLFAMSSDDFICDIALQLELRVATPGDHLIRKGDLGSEMYLIINGSVEVLDKDDSSQLIVLKEGDYFGEIALIEDVNRTATVKALTFCNLYVLKKATFDAILAKYPEVANKVMAKAKDRGEMYK